jgi:hypothetical protein
MIREKILNIKINYVLKARCHYQSFPSKTLSKKTWTKCLLSLSKFFDHLCQRIGGKSCKHEKMAPTLTKYENIAVTLCLMSIAILRRGLQDRARVSRSGQLDLGCWEGNKEVHTRHFLKNCTLKTRTSSEIILEWTKQHSRCSLRKWDHW